jgi:hypothetical protein
MTNSKGHGGLGNALIYFCGIGLAVSSMVKFLHPVRAVAYMRYLGYEHETLFLIAGVELLTAVLLLLRSTRSAGLLLASSYLGGAISAHLANHPFFGGGPFLVFNANHQYLGTLPAMMLLASAWVGVWLRHPESLWSFTRQENTGLGEATHVLKRSA